MKGVCVMILGPCRIPPGFPALIDSEFCVKQEQRAFSRMLGLAIRHLWMHQTSLCLSPCGQLFLNLVRKNMTGTGNVKQSSKSFSEKSSRLKIYNGMNIHRFMHQHLNITNI